MIVISDPKLPKVSTLFDFPLDAVHGNALETVNIELNERHTYKKPSELLQTIEQLIKETDVVLDIGCGIRPMNYFKPKLHILVEPHQEYVDILTYRNGGDKGFITFKQNALQALTQLANQSVDSVFLLDVIEHIDKEEGLKIIQECERVAREQIIIFTPLGFMPQHIHDIDAWGLNGGSLQEHLSGWTPEDFNTGWSLHLCNEFHSHDAYGTPLTEPFGAFFAIKNIRTRPILPPENLSKLRIPFFSMYDAQKLYEENINYKHQLIALNNSRGMRLVNFLKKILTIFKIRYWFTQKRA